MKPDQMIYLDNNATAPVRPEVARLMADAWLRPGNPSSIHGFGRQARNRIETARQDIARLIGAKAENIIFTSGGTEANNLALRCAPARTVLVSAIEHESVARFAITPEAIIPVLSTGVIDLAALDAMLAAAPASTLVSIMLVNNETGILQPVAEAAEIAHRHGALLHCDAVQALGKTPFDCTALGADLVSLSAHKFGGPQGIGALILRNGLDITGQMLGGGQERGRRAGTENAAGIAGFALAAKMAADALPALTVELSALRDRLEQGVAALTPGAVFFGRDQARAPNTSCFALPGVTALTQVMNLDLAGIAVSAGSACSSGKVTRSAVLAAMGIDDALAGAAIRVSLGWASNAADIDAFLAAWEMIAGRMPLRRAG